MRFLFIVYHAAPVVPVLGPCTFCYCLSILVPFRPSQHPVMEGANMSCVLGRVGDGSPASSQKAGGSIRRCCPVGADGVRWGAGGSGQSRGFFRKAAGSAGGGGEEEISPVVGCEDLGESPWSWTLLKAELLALASSISGSWY